MRWKKMNPPLRSHEDRMALIEGLEDWNAGFHRQRPCPAYDGRKNAADGQGALWHRCSRNRLPAAVHRVCGPPETLESETAAGVDGRKAREALRVWKRPASCAKAIARISSWRIFDRTYTIDPADFESKGKNTPFGGWTANVCVMQTWSEGRPVWTRKDK